MLLFLKNLSTLCRLPIALMTGFSAFAGCLLAGRQSPLFAFMVSLGVLLLAAGASALNQYQEREIDSRMDRTRHRPLPSGEISPAHALVIALLLIGAGLALLSAFGTTPILLGIFAITWYNGLYTWLKPMTAFAAVPGGLVGMIPPAIGWSAAQGMLSDPRLLAVCFFFFFWQVPHFWLQLLDHGGEYDRAGLPSLTGKLGRPAVCRLTYTWTIAAVVSALLLPLYGVVSSPGMYLVLVPAAVIVGAACFRLLHSWTRSRTLSAFRLINGYLLLVLSLLVIEGLHRMP